MSFAKNAKKQILESAPPIDCCGLAFLSGLVHSAGELEYINGKQKVYVLTDIQSIYEYSNKILHSLYGDFMELEIEDDFKINKTTYYKLILPQENLQNILKDLGFIKDDGTFDFSGNISPYIVQSECCKRAFITGAFVGCSTSSIVISSSGAERTNSGYHIEFISHSHKFLLNLSSLLAEFNIIGRIVQRKKTFVLYIKEAEMVSDLLALVGAFDCVLKLQNELALRELRNKINRQTNCMNANIGKTVEASIKQLNAIQTISQTIGLETLPEDLQMIALMRLANPEETLEELIKLSKTKLTKSGLNHRFRKLLKIAKELED